MKKKLRVMRGGHCSPDEREGIWDLKQWIPILKSSQPGTNFNLSSCSFEDTHKRAYH